MNMRPPQEPKILVNSREELLYLLAEAAEIEHNLMCCYLFAAFGLKTQADGLTKPEAQEVKHWRDVIVHVAVDEMTHLALVANLTAAIGGTAHFSRPNFPVAAGYHPRDVVVELRAFDRDTLDHFIFLERPVGLTLNDGAGFLSAAAPNYKRETASARMMPSAQDYLTVGHLYRSIQGAFETLSAGIGEEALFVGNSALQVGPEITALRGLCTVTDLASARLALTTIVEQGEGSPGDVEDSHYRKFVHIREAYERLLLAHPSFTPSRPVAANPVMRRPPNPAGKTYINHPTTAKAMDFANAVYATMLRALVQGFAETDASRKSNFISAATSAMFSLVRAAEYLSTQPACADRDDLHAGISFAMLRDVAPLPVGDSAIKVIAERFDELAAHADGAMPVALGSEVKNSLTDISKKLRGVNDALESPAVEVAIGESVTIMFEAKRCIHARFCVLQQPAVFKANVSGPWLAPDEASSVEALVAVAQACPSGAIQYVRQDGGRAEEPPTVNLIQIRENGPLALRADIQLDNSPIGYRATLCRCGKSNNKPFCDGAHLAANFSATGEPVVADITTLAQRDGVLTVRPQKNGPLSVSGSMEMISGTGRTFSRTSTAVLCRCGQSKSKPFCDGSHVSANFRAP